MTYKVELINQEFINTINADNFEHIALSVFRYQYNNNAFYRLFTDTLNISPHDVKEIEQIPFLPISFFKTHKIKTGTWDKPALVFETSGTTGEIPGRHLVYDQSIYRESLLKGFEQFYGKPNQYAILALLPSYLERKNASLVHMAKVLMEESKHPANGFYLDEWEKLANTLRELENKGQKVLLLGVTFALLDFAQAYPMSLSNTIVMETGGMKGRREEWTRAEVHNYLRQQWHLQQVHSEYGMTELLSQAYALQDGIFTPSSTMRVLVRDINDPLEVKKSGVGCLNIIDLANIHSCSFIATEDIGDIAPDGTFQVLGRMDHAVLRGCSLMVI
ncbi:MAG TPA: hypothetical protein VN721_07730 [Flavipsychrobacter sp.]|nr:hypothetical protein [Flavipsychrobacter sp.]